MSFHVYSSFRVLSFHVSVWVGDGSLGGPGVLMWHSCSHVLNPSFWDQEIDDLRTKAGNLEDENDELITRVNNLENEAREQVEVNPPKCSSLHYFGGCQARQPEIALL